MTIAGFFIRSCIVTLWSSFCQSAGAAAVTSVGRRPSTDMTWPSERCDERQGTMKFRSEVEPPQPMRGLEVPPEVIDALGDGKRPRVKITIGGHSWQSRIA